jgi:hypothetical protein
LICEHGDGDLSCSIRLDNDINGNVELACSERYGACEKRDEPRDLSVHDPTIMTKLVVCAAARAMGCF